LKVEDKNTPALTLYRQLGYRETAESKLIEDKFVPLAHLTDKNNAHTAAQSEEEAQEWSGGGGVTEGGGAKSKGGGGSASASVDGGEVVAEGSEGLVVCTKNLSARLSMARAMPEEDVCVSVCMC
jgi:hypothetical protein